MQISGGNKRSGDLEISSKERMQMRQLVDGVTIDAHYMTTIEACTQFKVYLEQLMRLLQMFSNCFVRHIANDLVSTNAFVDNNVSWLQVSICFILHSDSFF